MKLLEIWKNRLNVKHLGWSIIFGVLLSVAALIAPDSTVPTYLLQHGIPFLMKALPSWPIAIAMLLICPLLLLAYFRPGHSTGEMSASFFILLFCWLAPALTSCSAALLGTAIVSMGWAIAHPGGMGLALGMQLIFIAGPLLWFVVMLCWAQQGVSERQPAFEPLKYRI